MAEFQAVSHAKVSWRRFRASATVSFTLAVDESSDGKRPIRRKSAKRDWVPLGLREPGVRWDVLPERIPPEQWMTGQADAAVPGSILAAEAERRPEGYYPGG
jgi:hypothetical protein